VVRVAAMDERDEERPDWIAIGAAGVVLRALWLDVVYLLTLT
jgi:hypothetical protein